MDKSDQFDVFNLLGDLGEVDDFTFNFDPALGDGPASMDEVGIDPGVFLPNDEGRTEFLPPDPDKVPVIEHAMKQDTPEYAARPAEERTRELFAYMRPQRAVLLGILAAAANPVANSQMELVIDDLRAAKFSVYTPSNLCTMLEAAGALDRVTPQGEPYGDYRPQPEIVTVDGVEFYKPTYPPEVCWVATAAGAAMVEANDPDERLREMFAKEADFLRIYKRVLVLGQAEQGVSISRLSAAVDSDPLIEDPRRFFVQHFVEGLERCDSLAWTGNAWKTTEAGLHALELLSDVVDDYVPDPARMARTAGEGTVPTETQGVNW